MDIFFHLTEEEYKELDTAFPCDTYFFGAFNTVNVYQMRAFGTLYLLERPADIAAFRKGLKIDLDRRTNNGNVSFMNQVTTEEKRKALKDIAQGKFFKFMPFEYASHMYVRG